MRILVIDTYYPVFLGDLYREHEDLERRPYSEQWRVLMDACFGTADFYSSNLAKLGHEAAELVCNAAPLQRRWAQEHGLRLKEKTWGLRMRRGIVPTLFRRPSRWLYEVLAAQVKTFRPDVVHFQDPAGTDPALLREIRPYVRLLTAQIASPYAPQTNFSPYDLMLSSFPHFVKQFQQMGLRSSYFRLGFEPRVLERVRRTAPHDAVFAGGFSPSHSERIRFFEKLTRRFPIDWWGYGVDNLEPDSPLRAAYRGPAWALDMYECLHNARIAVNHHIDAAENFANNMRLYEATGVGAMLLTDAKENLPELFEPGREAVAYRSVEECAELIRYYLDHEEERRAIARAGQERTLREHTYLHRMEEFLEIVKRHL
jgi:hypothetical protein